MTDLVPLADPTLRTAADYPFCPGCGHGPVLDGLDKALVQLELGDHQVVIVSDIGCAGLSDQYFTTSAFHGLHGRSITYASGIKLARPDLDVVVIMGDGGTGIGGAHLLSAARRNIGITVLVLNNLNFGMTGGQHSATTPEGFLTATTPGGNLERPLDICATVGVNGAGYVYRGTSFDDDLAERIAAGIRYDGFAMLDVWDLCTAYLVRSNKFSRRAIDTTMEHLGFATGVLYENDRPEYAAAYRELSQGQHSALPPRPTAAAYPAPLDRRYHLVIAGSAGGRVRSAARLVGLAGMRAGLWAAQRDDFPVTVKSGHSVSELILGPDEIDYTGVERPDALVIVSDDGFEKAPPYLEAMDGDGVVFVAAGLPTPETAARVVVVDPSTAEVRIASASMALALMSYAVAELGIVPLAAFEEVAGAGAHGPKNMEIVTAGMALAG